MYQEKFYRFVLMVPMICIVIGLTIWSIVALVSVTVIEILMKIIETIENKVNMWMIDRSLRHSFTTQCRLLKMQAINFFRHLIKCLRG